jgi:hypothetical protein
MSKTPDQVRLEHGVRWRAIWPYIDGLKRNDVMAAAHRQGPLAGPFAEAAILTAVLHVSKAVQTDIEDFIEPRSHRIGGDETTA